MSSLCKLSKHPEVNLNRFRKAVAQNDHLAVQYLWNHVDVAHHWGNLLCIAAQHSDSSIVEKILTYADANNQDFYDCLGCVVSHPINPHWRKVFPLFLDAAPHKTKALFLANYLIFSQHLKSEVVEMVANNIKDNSQEHLFNSLAERSAKNNRIEALKYIWPYCNSQLFFDENPLSVWAEQKSETFNFLFHEFSHLQRDVLLQHINAGTLSTVKKM